MGLVLDRPNRWKSRAVRWWTTPALADSPVTGEPSSRVACGVAAALGFLLTDVSSNAFGDRAAAMAAGGVLAMLTNSLIPFAYERGKQLAGVATVIGFCLTLGT